MAYCGNSDIAARIGERVVIELTDDERLISVGDTLAEAIIANSAISTRLAAAITDADIMIDAHVRKRYDVPVDGPPALLTKMSVCLAIHALHTRRQSDFGVPESVQKQYDQALQLLRGINRGEIDLGIEPPAAASSIEVAEADGEDRIWTHDTLSGM